MSELIAAKEILVLDNDASMRAVMRFMLERAGHRPCLVERGEEAIARYREAQRRGHPFDAVILDWHARGTGIRETIKKLLETDPKAKAVVSCCILDGPPVVDFREYGFLAMLAKPFTSDELEQAVQAVFNGPAQTKKTSAVAITSLFLTGHATRGASRRIANPFWCEERDGRVAAELSAPVLTRV